MRVLMLDTDAGATSGVGVYTKQLVRALGSQLEVIHLSPRVEVESDSIFSEEQICAWTESLIAQANGICWDVVHAQGAPAAQAAAYLSGGEPWVLTKHCWASPQNKSSCAGSFFKFQRDMVSKASIIISVSERIKKQVIAAVPCSRVRTIHSGLGGAMAGVRADQLCPPLRVFHFGGRVSKGTELARRAFLRIAGPEDVLHIVGKVDATFRELADNDHPSVVWHGKLSLSAAQRVLLGCNLLLMTSFAEGLPLVALEAQSYGIPVLGCAEAATAEIIDPGRTGLIIPREEAAIAHAMMEYKESRLKFDSVDQIASWVSFNFSWGKCAASHISIYRSLQKCCFEK